MTGLIKVMDLVSCEGGPDSMLLRRGGTCSMRILCLLLVLSSVVVHLTAAQREDYPEPEFTQWQQLENWEERQLRKADQAFADTKAGERRWRLAAARYAAFADEFPESIALPFAIYRQGRCQHQDNKRQAARQHYTDVMEFFPDDAAFACAAAFFKGQSYMQDSDGEKAMPVWALIPKNEAWRKQPLAGYAILVLSEYLWGKGEPEKATGYLRQLVLDFRHKNADACATAIDKVTEFHVRIKPDAAHLRDFFVEARGFGKEPLKDREVPKSEDVLEGRYREAFWGPVRAKIKNSLKQFGAEQAAERKVFAGHWAQAMAGKNPKWDDFQIYQAYLALVASGQTVAFVKRIDEVFAAGYTPGDNDRVLTWLGYHRSYEDYQGDGEAFKEYFQKLDFAKMTFDHLRRALELAYGAPKDAALLAGIVKQKIVFDQCTDEQLVWLAEYLYQKEDKDNGLRAARTIGKADLADITEFRLIAQDGNVALEAKETLASKLYKVEQYASEVFWSMGRLYRDLKRYPEAINAFHRAGKGAESGFAAADCHWRAGKLEPAILELEAVVGMFKESAPKALLTMAKYYDGKGKEAQRNETLVRLLTDCKETREWSAAHVWAEDLGLKFRGETERD